MRPRFRNDFFSRAKKRGYTLSNPHYCLPLFLLFHSSSPPLPSPLLSSPLLSQRDGLQQPALHPDFQAFPHLHPKQSRPQQQAEGTLTSIPSPHLVSLFPFFFCLSPDESWCDFCSSVSAGSLLALISGWRRFSGRIDVDSPPAACLLLWPETQKFYTSAAFHLHSQCHLLFRRNHSLSLFFFLFFFFEGLSHQGYDTICCLRKTQTFFFFFERIK